MKNVLAAGTLALTAMTTGAQTQTPGVQIQTGKNIEKALTLPVGEDMQIRVDNSNGASEVSAGVTILLADGKTQLRIAAGAQKALVAAGWVFHDDGKVSVTGLLGGSTTRQSITGVDPNNSPYNATLQNKALFGEVSANGDLPIGMSSIRAGVVVQKAGAKDLHRSTANVQTVESGSRQAQSVTQNPDGSTTYTTTEITDKNIKDYLYTYNTVYGGGDAIQAHIAADWSIGKNGTATITLTQEQIRPAGQQTRKSTTAEAAYKHLIPRGNVEIGVNDKKAVRVGYNALINRSTSFSIGAQTGPNARPENGHAYVQLNMAIGDTGSNTSSTVQNPAINPISGVERLRAHMNGIGPTSSKQAKNPTEIGEIHTGVTQQLLGERVESASQVVATKTVPGPEKPVVPNTPLNIGNISCTATVIQHGQTTTCQITPVDPDGIQSLRAELDGSTVSTTKSGNTYSIILSGIPVGSVGGAPSGTHTLRVYATGKKPDDTSESEQSTTISIEVQCGGAWVPIPGIPGGGICSI